MLVPCFAVVGETTLLFVVGPAGSHFPGFPRQVKTASRRMQETKKYMNLSAALKGKMGEEGGGERGAGTSMNLLPIKKSREALQF